jgi:uncharacterized protein YukE
MAELNLTQVPGSQTVTAAAALVGYQDQIANLFGYNFGDPDLIQQVAGKWGVDALNAVRDGKNMLTLGSVGGTSGGKKEAVQRTWTGDASGKFFAVEGTLESGYTTTINTMTAVGKQLTDLSTNIRTIFGEAVGVTLAAIAALSQLLPALAAGKKAAVAANAPSTPSSPTTNPVLVPGPDGSVQLAGAPNPNPNKPAGGPIILGVQLTPDLKKKIIEILLELIAAITAYGVMRQNFNGQVNNAILSLAQTTGDNTGLVDGKLPAVPGGLPTPPKSTTTTPAP